MPFRANATVNKFRSLSAVLGGGRGQNAQHSTLFGAGCCLARGGPIGRRPTLTIPQVFPRKAQQSPHRSCTNLAKVSKKRSEVTGEASKTTATARSNCTSVRALDAAPQAKARGRPRSAVACISRPLKTNRVSRSAQQAPRGNGRQRAALTGKDKPAGPNPRSRWHALAPLSSNAGKNRHATRRKCVPNPSTAWHTGRHPAGAARSAYCLSVPTSPVGR